MTCEFCDLPPADCRCSERAPCDGCGHVYCECDAWADEPKGAA